MLRKLKDASKRLQQLESPATTGVIPTLPAGAVPILERLKSGQRWLTEQHNLWLADGPQVVSDEQLSAALAGWDALERVFRCSGYTGCIWGSGGCCPDDSPVLCDGCVGPLIGDYRLRRRGYHRYHGYSLV